jgi:hypothetical protein
VPIEVGSIFIAIAALSYFVFQQDSLRALTSAGLACLAGALYAGGLFVAPASATFVLAGVLAYMSLRQVHSEALSTFAVEGILIFFVVGHASYFIVHALTSFSVVALVASATAIAAVVVGGTQLVRIFWIKPRYPHRTQNLLGLPSAQLVIALTFIAAVAALEAGYALDAYSSLKGIVL